MTIPTGGNRQKYFVVTSRGHSEHFYTVPRNKQPTTHFFMLPESAYEIHTIFAVNVVDKKPVLTQVGSTTLLVYGNCPLDNQIDAQPCHERGKSAFVLSFFIRPDKGHVRKSCLCLNGYNPFFFSMILHVGPTR